MVFTLTVKEIIAIIIVGDLALDALMILAFLAVRHIIKARRHVIFVKEDE